MKAPTKKGGRPLARKTAIAAKLVKSTPVQAIVERMQHVLAEIDHLPLPIGKLGCQFLDCLELCDKIREKVRSKARDLLLKEPGIIPHWHVSETAQRRLSPDTARVFDALSREDDRLTPSEFLEACTTNLGALRKLLVERDPELSPDELEHALNRALVDLISYDTVTSLSRSKSKQIELSL
jgi:hypothetical protein